MDEPWRVVGPPASRVVESEVDGQISLYHPDAEEVLVLNQSASDIWRLSDGTQTLDQIVTLLAGTYGVDPSEIRDDVADTVSDLRHRGLLDADTTA